MATTGAATVFERALDREAAELELSVIMPCLNEARTIGTCIRKAQTAIREHGIDGEVIVADNGSTDGSLEVAERLGARVVHVPTRGYGAALAAGIQASRAVYIIMGDADDSYDFGAIFPFVERLREGYDFVMGCRFPRGGGSIAPGAMPWKHRWLGNPALSWLGRKLFRSRVTDFYCGMRAFRREVVLGLDLRTTGMEYATEMVIKAATLGGVRMSEIPITLYPDGRDRPPHLQTWRDGWRTLRFMLLLSPRWLFLVPGVLMFALGAFFMAALIPGPLKIGPAGLDTTTMLIAAMTMIVGYQVVIYAVFTRAFAVTEHILRADRLTERALRLVTLERGLLIGFVLVLVGVGAVAYATVLWRELSWGAFNYARSQRFVIPGVTAVIIGIQTMFSSFFLSVLGLSRR